MVSDYLFGGVYVSKKKRLYLIYLSIVNLLNYSFIRWALNN
jgi:hypothetical protein